mgnify:CR=1 FL=1
MFNGFNHVPFTFPSCLVYHLSWYFAPDNGQSIYSSSAMSGTQILTVKALHINSAILAARSPFFLKVFLIPMGNAFVVQSFQVPNKLHIS